MKDQETGLFLCININTYINIQICHKAQEVYRHRVEAARINAERTITAWQLPECNIVEDSIEITEKLYSYLTNT